MRTVLKRAWSDSFAFLGGWGLVAGVFAIPVVGMGLHYWLQGWDAMIPEAKIWLLYGLASTGLVFGSVFFWNLACAPFRIERDKRIEVEKERDDLVRRFQSSKNRRLTVEQKASLTDVLRSYSAKPDSVYVLYYPSSEECGDLAADLSEAISAAGIESTAHQGSFFQHNSTDRGLKIFRGKQEPGLAEEIQHCLERFGFPIEKRDFEDDAKGIFLYVARGSDS
ncbi:MAG: hypothetical protein WBO29_06800 [Albidovulum sp.]